MPHPHELLLPLRRMHEMIRDTVVAATERSSLENLSSVAAEEQSDTIYAIDRISEEVLIDFLDREIARRYPIVLIAEGLEHGSMTLPRDARDDEAVWRIIVDPIDGTRGLMYQKRSAWILTGVAPNLGSRTGLRDIVLAIQTEIPLAKQHLSDVLWAVRGEGAHAERLNRLTGERVAFPLQPSRADSIAHGFSTFSRFFPGVRDELAAIDDEVVLAALGPALPGKALIFEDQYIAAGGQLYELMVGHDRFVGDIRPLLEALLLERGHPPGLYAHPYDLCTELIARELGVIVTDPFGNLLDVPLDTQTSVAWAGYANEKIRAQIEPLLQASLQKRGILPPEGERAF